MSESKVRLQKEIIEAMKSNDKERLKVLRMMQAAVKQVEIDTREELDEDTVIKIISAYAKKVKDSLAGAIDCGRDEMAAEAEAELEIVKTYLPAELSDEELQAIVEETIAETNAESMQQMGLVMKAAMPKCGGRADGNRVSAMVKQLLTG